ncbi:MAG: zf-HC2 domain-containing protein [Pseudomonadota bacterium]
MTKTSTSEHQRAWDLLPWYINGTLGPEEAEFTERHIASCPECRAELARQEQLSEVVSRQDGLVPDQSAALDMISARLTAQRRRSGWMARIQDFVDNLLSSPARGMKIGIGLAAAVLLVVVIGAPQTDTYRTLTTPDAASSEIEIRVRYAPDTDPEAVRALLRELGATEVTGPSETSLIRAEIAPHLSEDIVDALRNNPLILFVAVDN